MRASRLVSLLLLLQNRGRMSAARLAAELGVLKLMAALPTPYRDASVRIRQRFHLDAPGWYREADAVPQLLAAAEALWRDQVVEIRYRRWSPAPGVVTRRLHPLGLVLKAGVWYLVAGPEPRTYRVGNIEEFRALDEHFTRPAGFELAEFWRAHVQRYEEGEDGETALIRLSPAGIAALPDILGPRAARLVARTLEPADAEGWQRAEIPLESVSHATAGLLRLGADAQVLAPPELMAHIGKTIREMVRLYP